MHIVNFVQHYKSVMLQDDNVADWHSVCDLCSIALLLICYQERRK